MDDSNNSLDGTDDSNNSDSDSHSAIKEEEVVIFIHQRLSEWHLWRYLIE